MMHKAQKLSLVRSPWTDHLCELLSTVEENLLIACPFVKKSGTDHILAELERRTLRDSIHVGLITDLRPESVLAGSMDIDALVDLGTHIPNFRLTHLPGVHAKVYIADSRRAIVTSGNLTHSGLRGNVEYGISLTDETLVREIREDFEGFAWLGAGITTESLGGLSSEMRNLKSLFSRAQKTIRQQARYLFEERLEQAHNVLLRQRVLGGTTHSIFAGTIKFLLGKGPLRTSEMQPLIQAIHPDLCDDAVDRTIDGVNFGKKWKHHVRSAQQHLKRQGEITYSEPLWSLRTL